MYLVAIVWLYIALMIAVAEATHTQGTVLGAVFTFILYGAAPVALVTYLLGTPGRRRARRAAQAAHAARAVGPLPLASPTLDPDERRHAPGDTVSPERIEP